MASARLPQRKDQARIHQHDRNVWCGERSVLVEQSRHSSSPRCALLPRPRTSLVAAPASGRPGHADPARQDSRSSPHASGVSAGHGLHPLVEEVSRRGKLAVPVSARRERNGLRDGTRDSYQTEQSVQMHEFQEGLGRAASICGALDHDRPFLAPLYSFASRHAPQSVKPQAILSQEAYGFFCFCLCTVTELIVVVCCGVVSERSFVEVIRVTDHACCNSVTEFCGSGARVAAVTQQ